MKRIWGVLIPVALVFLIAGCGDDDSGPTAAQDNSPDAVADLAVIAVDDSTVTLTWNAPDDKWKLASVSAYDLRYSTANITEENFADADTVPGEPEPGEAAEADTFTVEGLDLGTTYYFAMKSADNKDQWSDISNVIQAATDSIDNRLIAYYPLVDDSIDVSGNQVPMFLTNTPFQEGGIYCNGIYINDGDPQTEGSLAQTPDLFGFDFRSFTISVHFKVAEYDTLGWNYVLVGGETWRWVGFRLHPDSTVNLFSPASTMSSTIKYDADTWHEGRITYDGTTASLYLDGTPAAEMDIDIQPTDDPNINTTHFGNGNAFEGIWGRLKVYNGVVAP